MYQVPEDREKFTKQVWERLIEAVDNPYTTPSEGFEHLPATAQFALTTPALFPRVSKIEGIRPFGFLTVRYLDPAALPDGAETFELLPFHSPKEVAWLGLAEKEGAKTWAHILEAFSRHRDRKYLVGPDGRILRRSVLVRESSRRARQGGNEARDACQARQGGSGARPRSSSTGSAAYLQWDGQRRNGRGTWNRVGGWKRTFRKTGTLRGDALHRLKGTLIGSG